MNKQLSIFNNVKMLARAAIIVVFLALIRCIAEVLWLHYYATAPLMHEQCKPCILGALAAAVFLFALTTALFYTRYKLVILLAVLTIITLLLKQLYLT